MLGPDDPVFHKEAPHEELWIDEDGASVNILGLSLKIGCRVAFMDNRKPMIGILRRYHPRYMTAIIERAEGFNKGKCLRVKVDRMTTFGEVK